VNGEYLKKNKYILNVLNNSTRMANKFLFKNTTKKIEINNTIMSFLREYKKLNIGTLELIKFITQITMPNLNITDIIKNSQNIVIKNKINNNEVTKNIGKIINIVEQDPLLTKITNAKNTQDYLYNL
jgi:hypothetical protein